MSDTGKHLFALFLGMFWLLGGLVAAETITEQSNLALWKAFGLGLIAAPLAVVVGGVWPWQNPSVHRKGGWL